jgi:cytidine deaminase
MTEGDADLIDQARTASARAYAPYSRFHVGAAVRSASGAIHVGANVENAAYPIGVCAEAAALGAARTVEGDGFRLVAVAVIASRDGVEQSCSPCGACRQRLLEFSASARVLFQDGPDLRLVCEPARALLPFGFTLQP